MNGVFYCRRHESAHLRITAEAEALNLARLGHGLTGDANGCWLWGGSTNDNGYGTFVPEGANTAKWLAHRVVWGLLIGGHEPGLELDHRTCKRRNCGNPLHLEPVTKSTNQRRKRQGPDREWINPDAVKDPRVTEFAHSHGLPLPIPTEPAPPSRPPRRLAPTSPSAGAWPRLHPPPEGSHAQPARDATPGTTLGWGEGPLSHAGAVLTVRGSGRVGASDRVQPDYAALR